MSHLVSKEFILRGFWLYFSCYHFLARSSLAPLEENNFDTDVLPSVSLGQKTMIKPWKHLHFSNNTTSLHLLFYLVEEGNRLKVKVTNKEFLGRPIKLQNKDHVQYEFMYNVSSRFREIENLTSLIKGNAHFNSLVK